MGVLQSKTCHKVVLLLSTISNKHLQFVSHIQNRSYFAFSNAFQNRLSEIGQPSLNTCAAVSSPTDLTFIDPSIYNILRWVAWTMGQTNRWPRVWCSKYYFFFLIFHRLSALKTLNFYFCNFIRKLENKLKGFWQRIWQEIMKKNNTLNIRCLVDDSFVP